jgi:hypothetical protein
MSTWIWKSGNVGTVKFTATDSSARSILLGLTHMDHHINEVSFKEIEGPLGFTGSASEARNYISDNIRS